MAKEMTMTQVLDGRVVSASIRDRIREEVAGFESKPGLAVVLVGDNAASQSYVGMKEKACAEVGFESFKYTMDPSEGEAALISLIESLNERSDVHGILVQLPLPEGFDEEKVIRLIDPKKDVDGFHPESVGKLLIGLPTFKSCTPYGVMKILEYYDIDPSGQHVVILGRSNIVGKPLAAMLVQKEKGANATVTICHSRTKNLVEIASQADILVAAMGSPYFVKPEMVKEGAVVIDVGINRVVDAEAPRGYKLVGDVDYDAVASKCTAITPVPGGVGPMTIAMLLSNTLQSFKAG